MNSLLDVLKKTADFLGKKGVEHARLNAEHLIGHALGLKRMQLYLQFERLLAEPELENIRALIRRRAAREPLAHILGTADFAGLTLACDRRALVPRPETEELVELLTGRFTDAVPPPAKVLDLGTGSGAIALALARAWPAAAVMGADNSSEALELARENAARNGLAGRVSLVLSDWFSAPEVAAAAPFGLIVSNPPYLTAAEFSSAEPEVREHEPRGALAAGTDGLNDLRRIVAGAPALLAPGGLLALETGIAQHAALRQMAADAGFTQSESLKDLSGRDRFLLATKA